jgi:hypothetical protein
MKNKKVLFIALGGIIVIALVIIVLAQLANRPSGEDVGARIRLDGSGAVCVSLTQGETLSGYFKGAGEGSEDIQVIFYIKDSAGNQLISPRIVGDKDNFEITAPKEGYYYLYYDSNGPAGAGAPTVFLYLPSIPPLSPKLHELHEYHATVTVYDIDRETPLAGIVVRPQQRYKTGPGSLPKMPEKVEPAQQVTDASGTASFSYFLYGGDTTVWLEAEFGSWLGMAKWDLDASDTSFIVKPSLDVKFGVSEDEVGPLEPISVVGSVKNFGPFKLECHLVLFPLNSGYGVRLYDGMISPGETVRISRSIDPSTYTQYEEKPIGTWPNGMHETNLSCGIYEGERWMADSDWYDTWGVPPY